MHARFLLAVFLSPWIGAWSVAAEPAAAIDPPARQTVVAELQAEPEFIFHGKGEKKRSNIDKVVAPIPSEILAAVKEWAGDIDTFGRSKGISVTFIHSPIKPVYKAMSFGDWGSFTAKITVAGKDLVDEETHVRYKEVVAACDEETYFVLGLYEFENSRTKRTCYVVCQCEGNKPPADEADSIIHPTGTATWNGPIVGPAASLFEELEEAAAGR